MRPLAIIGVLAVLAALAAAVWGYAMFTRPGPLVVDRTLVLPRGAGVREIAHRLATEGVIADALVFHAAVRINRAERLLQAGEYRFAARSSMRDVMNLLREGRTVVRRFTVAEGLTVSEVIGLLEQADGLIGEVTAPPAEGSLLPETYHFSYGDSRQDMIARMQAEMSATLATLWSQRRPGLPLQTPAQAVVLASIVEKETALTHERRHIAGVFVNRLSRGMRLQSDPTVAYALTNGATALTRPLSRADLATPSPYNTYQVDGLPPGPIANPGRDALAAVLQPEQTPDLYFVADGTGGHAFASTFAEHQKNVSRWRALRRQNTPGKATE